MIDRHAEIRLRVAVLAAQVPGQCPIQALDGTAVDDTVSLESAGIFAPSKPDQSSGFFPDTYEPVPWVAILAPIRTPQ